MHGQNLDLPVCVCVSVPHTFCQLAYVRPLDGCFTVYSLKDADLRKYVSFGTSMMNNHI